MTFVFVDLLVCIDVGIPVIRCSQVSRPEIKERRFDFSVTYELNGEIKTLTGIYECKFEDIDWSLDRGYTKEWSDRIDGIDNVNEIRLCTTEDGGIVSVRFGFSPGCFMNDLDAGVIDSPNPRLILSYDNAATREVRFTDDAAIIEGYGVKLISYKYDPPIKISFGLIQ